jgi:hypothetical protein
MLARKSTASPAIASATPTVSSGPGGASSLPHREAEETTVIPPAREENANPVATDGMGNPTMVEALAADTIGSDKAVRTGGDLAHL